MHNPEKPYKEPKQTDFFDVLDDIVPNEDSFEVAINTFGTKFRFDPKLPGQFEISNSTAQMTAEVHFDKAGTITNIDIRRWDESDPIEPGFQKIFRQDAEKVLREYQSELGLAV